MKRVPLPQTNTKVSFQDVIDRIEANPEAGGHFKAQLPTCGEWRKAAHHHLRCLQSTIRGVRLLRRYPKARHEAVPRGVKYRSLVLECNLREQRKVLLQQSIIPPQEIEAAQNALAQCQALQAQGVAKEKARLAELRAAEAALRTSAQRPSLAQRAKDGDAE